MQVRWQSIAEASHVEGTDVLSDHVNCTTAAYGENDLSVSASATSATVGRS